MAPRERHTETIIGSISGVRPTATASAKKNASFQSPFVSPLMRNTSGTITSMKRIISQVKRLTPLSKLVGAACPTMRLGHGAQIGLESRFHDHSRGRAAFHAGAEKTGVLEFQRRPGAAVFLGVELLHGQRFPGQARLDDEQVLAGYEAEIGRNHVARRELDHVAGHEVAQRQLPGLPVAKHRRRDADHGLELSGGVAGPQFLDESQAHPQDDHGQHDARPPEIVGPPGKGRQQQQQDHQGVGAGLAQEFEPPEPLFLRDHVGAVLLQAAGGFVLAQALVAGFQPAKYLLGIAPGDLREQGRNLDRASPASAERSRCSSAG